MFKYKNLTVTDDIPLKYRNQNINKIFFMQNLIYNYENIEPEKEYKLIQAITTNGGKAYAEMAEFIPDQTWAVDALVQPFNTGFVFGNRVGYGQETFSVYFEKMSTPNASRAFTGFGKGNWDWHNLPFALGKLIRLYSDIYVTRINHIEILNTNNNDFVSNKGIYIGAMKGDSRTMNGQIYNFTLLQNGIIKYDLRPAIRNLDGKVGLLDIINNQFYPSITDVDFVAVESSNENSDINLDFLTDEGNSYISTGLYNNRRYKIEGRFSLPDNYTSDGSWLFGARGMKTSEGMGLFIASFGVFTAYDAVLLSQQPALPAGGVYDFVFQPESLVVTDIKEGNVYNYPVPGDGIIADASKVEIRLCGNEIAYNGIDPDLRNFRGNVHNIKITDLETNTLLRDYIPVISNETFRVAFYDNLNKTYHYSEGSEEFVAGDVSSEKAEYEEIPYLITTNGLQYIDTELAISNTRHRIETNLYVYTTSTVNIGKGLMGVRSGTGSISSCNLFYNVGGVTNKVRCDWINPSGYEATLIPETLTPLILSPRTVNIGNQELNWAEKLDQAVLYNGFCLGNFKNSSTIWGEGITQRIYRTKFYVDASNTLIGDFIPIKLTKLHSGYPAGTLGMFDLVSNTFFGNKGTGEFLETL